MYICTYVTFLFDRSWLFYSFFFNTQQVEQRDVPGIDNAFLAMDTEEGVEVVWNEVQFSGNRNLKEQQVTIDLIVFSHNFLMNPFKNCLWFWRSLQVFNLTKFDWPEFDVLLFECPVYVQMYKYLSKRL